MKTFDDLEFKEHPNKMGGVIARIEFNNGYGASVAQTPLSYGGDQGFYELAVIKDSTIVYDSPVTNDIEGYLAPEDVTRLMEQIQKL